MSSKSSIKYASIDAQHPQKDTEFKKVSRKSAETKAKVANSNRRSQSLDRTIDENSGDSREERRNRRQYMHLVGTLDHVNIEPFEY